MWKRLGQFDCCYQHPDRKRDAFCVFCWIKNQFHYPPKQDRPQEQFGVFPQLIRKGDGRSALNAAHVAQSSLFTAAVKNNAYIKNLICPLYFLGMLVKVGDIVHSATKSAINVR